MECDSKPCDRQAVIRVEYDGKVLFSANLCEFHKEEFWKMANPLVKTCKANVTFGDPK